MTRRFSPAPLFRAAAAAPVLAAALLAGACVTSRSARFTADEIAMDGAGGTLPVRCHGGLAFAEVSIDGRAPRPFLLDTGASVMIVSARAADEIGLPRVPLDDGGGDGTMSLNAAQGMTAQSREVVPVGEARAGPLVLRRIDAVVLRTDVLDGAMGVPVDGVLPAGAFREMLLTFDFPAQTVTVGPGELDPTLADVVALGPEPLPSITFDLAGAKFLALLDTGSTEYLSIPESVAASAPFRSPPVETGKFATAAGTAARHQGRLGVPMTLAGHRLSDPIVSLQPTERGGVGVELMQHFRVTFDLTHDRVRFERSSGDPLRSPPVRGIGAGFFRRDGDPTVAYVLDDSPAARAGLRAGDRVETIEGLPARQMSGELTEILFARSPTIRLGVVPAAGGPRRDLTIPVTTYVP